MNIYIYIWPYMADEKIYIYMYTQKLGKISFPTLPPRKKKVNCMFFFVGSTGVSEHSWVPVFNFDLLLWP